MSEPTREQILERALRCATNDLAKAFKPKFNGVIDPRSPEGWYDLLIEVAANDLKSQAPKTFTITVQEDDLNLLHDAFADAERYSNYLARDSYHEATAPELDDKERAHAREHGAELEKRAAEFKRVHSEIMKQLQEQ